MRHIFNAFFILVAVGLLSLMAIFWAIHLFAGAITWFIVIGLGIFLYKMYRKTAKDNWPPPTPTDRRF